LTSDGVVAKTPEPYASGRFGARPDAGAAERNILEVAVHLTGRMAEEEMRPTRVRRPEELMATAREEVLALVRDALRDVPVSERPEDMPVARERRAADDGGPEQRLARFAERVADDRGRVRLVPRADLPAALAEALQARGARRVVVPPDLPAEWRPAGVELLVDGELANDELDAADGVLTGCVLGIAETGTVVLDGGARQGRRAITLLPDYHLCVVEAAQIVGTVPEAIAALDTAARERRPITFVSGPSAASDLELRHFEGVHGPRSLEVLVVH
jgi:L-lactate dehydrogenase complex protein LldG